MSSIQSPNFCKPLRLEARKSNTVGVPQSVMTTEAAAARNCAVSQAPVKNLFLKALYPRSAVSVWNATIAGRKTPLLQRTWTQMSDERAHLITLGFTETTWTAAQRGDFREFPHTATQRFAALTPAQQEAAAALGLDARTWDALVASRTDLLANPAILQAFANHLERGTPIDADAVERDFLPQARFGVATSSGQRALAYVRDYFPNAFTPAGRAALTHGVSERRLGDFHSHGWTTTLLPERSAAELKRVADGGALMVNDAGGLSGAVALDMVQPSNYHDVRLELLRARALGFQVSPTGVRHSQGGQTARGGPTVHLDLRRLNGIKFEAAGDAQNTVWVGAGATWHDLLAHLRKINAGRTVVVQQASDIFSIGGSLSVNCHGRTRNDAPIVSTVEEVRVMLANGDIRNVSRTKDGDLFRNVIGGYGMHGIILGARLKTAADSYLRMQTRTVDEAAFPSELAATLRNEDNELAYARVSPTFTDNLITYAAKAPEPAAQKNAGFDFERIDMSGVTRTVLGVARLSKRVLQGTWDVQKRMRGYESFGYRRELLGLHANDLRMLPWCEGRNSDRLFEGFLPFDIHAQGEAAQHRDDSVRAFIRDLYQLQKTHTSTSLNDTVRYVRGDSETALPYAPANKAPGYLAFVLYYPQKIKKAESERLNALERDLIDTLARRGGSFYLPYSRAYTPAQFTRNYPGFDAALAFKSHVDPQGIFPVNITAQGVQGSEGSL